MDDVDRVIDSLHARAGSADEKGDLQILIPAVEALRHGGLSYALDHLRAGSFDRAADAARRLGSDELGRLLNEVAEIARTHRGFALDRAAADFDRRHGAAALHEALRAAVMSWRGP